MGEHEAILKDLQKYLKGRGKYVEVVYMSMGAVPPRWYITSFYHYTIVNDKIKLIGSGIGSIASLADPKYREKFAEFLTKGENVR